MLQLQEPAVKWWCSHSQDNSKFILGIQCDGLICQQLKTIVETEAPISKTLLLKRIIGAWGMARSGARIESRITDLCGRLNFYAAEAGDAVFYWQSKTAPKAFGYYRAPENESEKRSAEDIPELEYVNVMVDILENGSCT